MALLFKQIDKESKSENKIKSVFFFFFFFLVGGCGSERIGKIVSNSTFTLKGEQLCKIILKSMHKCRSYGQDKLNL